MVPKAGILISKPPKKTYALLAVTTGVPEIPVTIPVTNFIYQGWP